MKIDIDLVELEQKFDEILAIENHIFVTVSELARKTRPPAPRETTDSIFLRLKEVTNLTALSRSTIYNYYQNRMSSF